MKIGPRIDRSSRPSPSGAWSAKNARCCFENSLRSGAVPAATSCTGVFGTPLNDAEQTKPPGIASTSTMQNRESRTSSGNSDGTTGRSLTTESSPLRTRRARTTTPLRSSARSGVSKK